VFGVRRQGGGREPNPADSDCDWLNITECEERASIGIGTNLPFSEWGTISPVPRPFAAIVNRVTFNACIGQTGTQSCRLAAGKRPPARSGPDATTVLARDDGPTSPIRPTTQSRRPSRETTSAGRCRLAYDRPMERESVRRVVHVTHGPPENELPVVLTPGISWSGTGVVFAIPALFLYSTGIELLIMFRSARQQVQTTEDLSEAEGRRRQASAATLHARGITEKLNGLKVNGRPVTQLGEQFNDHGFDGRAWVPAEALVDGDQILTLDWPGIETAEQRITSATIANGRPKITALW
jgi:hypothetical protein